MARLTRLPPAVINRKLISLIGREDFGDFAQALGQGLRSEQAVVAFAQVVVVEVHGEREQVDGDRVGEGRAQKLRLGTLVDAGWGGGGAAAGVVGVDARLALYVLLRLFP